MAYIGNDPSNIQRGRRAQYHFTATASQTVFTGTDDDGQSLDLLEAVEADVYFNGSRLVLDDDYTISGDTLTLTAGAAAGDILVIVTQDDIVNLNSYTKSEADDRYINYNGDIVSGDIQVTGEVDAGSLIVDTDVLVVDATNNRVGIGNVSPTDDLHIGSSSGGTQVKIESGSGTNSALLYRTGGVDSWRVGMNLTATDGSLQFYDDVNNTSRVVIDSSGRVGIGTTSHYDNSTKLTVAGRINTSNGTVTGSMNYGNGTVLNVGTLSSHPLQLMTGNSTAMYIDTSGNVGIGETNPTSPLVVTTNTASDYVFRFNNTNSNSAGMLITAGGGSYPILKLRDYAGNDRVFFDNNGNIGIGTTTPTFSSGNGMHLKDNYFIGFGNGSVDRPDFQIGTTDGSFLDIRCGFGADTADFRFTTGGAINVPEDFTILLDYDATGDANFNIKKSDGTIMYQFNEGGHSKITSNADTVASYQVNNASLAFRSGIVNYFPNGDFTRQFVPLGSDGFVGTGTKSVTTTGARRTGYGVFKWTVTGIGQYKDLWDWGRYFRPRSNYHNYSLVFWAKNDTGSNIQLGTPGGGGGMIANIAGDNTWRKYVVTNSTGANSATLYENRTNCASLTGSLYFSEVMLIDGDARYILNEDEYIPSIYDTGSITQPGDPYWENVRLLLQEGIPFDQSGRHAISINGNASQSTTNRSPMGSNAIFNLATSGSSGNYLEVQDTLSDFNLGDADWTVEAWLYVYGTNSTYYHWFTPGGQSHEGTFKGYGVSGSNTHTSYFYSSNGGSGSIQPTVGRWNHIAYDFTNRTNNTGTVRQYLNGVLSLTTTSYTMPGGTPGSVFLGRNPDQTNEAVDFYIDGFRFTRGVARYKGDNFQPPSAPYPTYR